MKYKPIIQKENSQIQKAQFGAILKLIAKAAPKAAQIAPKTSGAIANTTAKLVLKLPGTKRAYFKHISPMGYTDHKLLPVSKKDEINAFLKEVFTPGRVKMKVDKDGQEIPVWVEKMQKKLQETGTGGNPLSGFGYLSMDNVIPLRLEAHAISTGMLKGKPRYYIKNADGTYSYNIEAINKLTEKNIGPRQKLTDLGDWQKAPPIEIRTPQSLEKFDSPEAISKFGHDFSTHDFITSNGGIVGVKIDPNTVSENLLGSIKKHPLTNQEYRSLGRPQITIQDTWDIQPLKDPGRSPYPQITDLGIKYPGTGWEKLKNIEILKAIGGKPFTVKQTLPKDQFNYILINNEYPWLRKSKK